VPGVYEEDYVYTFSASARSRGSLPIEVVTSSGHRIVVDEPPEGSKGTGPNPIELFLASLASCATASVLIHATRLGVKIESIEARASASFDIRGFLGIEGYDPSLRNVKLVLRIRGRDEKALREAVDKALNTWVVGSTVLRGTHIDTNVIIERC